jgi:subtilisin family serine protease
VDGPNAWQSKVDEWVLERAAAGETEFIIFLAEQADLSAAEALPTRLEKGRYVYNTLVETAQRTQPALLQVLESQGVPHQPYWVANMVWVRGGQDTMAALAQRSDVAHIFANPSVKVGLEEEEIASSSAERPPRNDTFSGAAGLVGEEAAVPSAIEWNLSLVGAPQVWQAGYQGQGVVIGGQDTGYDWDHPALINQYRGWDGTTAEHDYSWHDAIHEPDPHNLTGTNPCGLDIQAPCDDYGHGTHTMGIMVGDDGAGNQIGMAPEARWIGCRNMERGWGTPDTYIECYEWFIAPTDLNGENPDPARAPDVINNSWSCPESEGCTDPTMLETVVHNVTAAGILSVHAAGNSGWACSTVNTAAAIYSDSFSVANTTSADILADSSSRGPVSVDGSGRRKPDVAAPGTNIRSSLPGTGYGSSSGTSMAAPHVAGLVALLISARPELSGQVSYLRQVIEQSSSPGVNVPAYVPQACGGIPFTTVPNNHFGWGRIDAAKALFTIQYPWRYIFPLIFKDWEKQ